MHEVVAACGGLVQDYVFCKGFDIGFSCDLGLAIGVNFIAVPQASDSEYMLNPSLAIRF